MSKIESKTVDTDVSFKIVRPNHGSTYAVSLNVLAIDNGFVVDGVSGMRHYATLEDLRQALATIADRFVEEVTSHRAIVQERNSRLTTLEDQMTDLEKRTENVRNQLTAADKLAEDARKKIL